MNLMLLPLAPVINGTCGSPLESVRMSIGVLMDLACALKAFRSSSGMLITFAICVVECATHLFQNSTLNNFSIVPTTRSFSGLYRSRQSPFHCLDICSIHL